MKSCCSICIFILLLLPVLLSGQGFNLHLGAGMGYSHYPFQKSYRELPEAEITKVNEVLAAGGVIGGWRFLGFGLEGHLPISSDRIYSINSYACLYPFKKLPIYVAPGVSVSFWETHPFPDSFYEENEGAARREFNFGYHLAFDEK